MTRVVDASVAVKLGVLEQDSAKAKALIAASTTVVAPDLIVAEVASALWKKELRGQVTSAQRPIALASCVGAIDEFVPLKALAARALELAVALRHPVYDCFYLALAEARGGTFVTADARLLTRLGQGGWAGKFEAL